MHRSARWWNVGLAVTAFAWLPAPSTAAPPADGKSAVSVQVVKYDGLKNAVKAARGKILVVDVWSTT